MTNTDRLRAGGIPSIGGGGWAYCPSCDCLTAVFDTDWGNVITCTVCDGTFTPTRD